MIFEQKGLYLIKKKVWAINQRTEDQKIVDKEVFQQSFGHTDHL